MPEQTVDALVVGAGFGGILMLHELTKFPLSVKLIDMAGDVGGTWWYNRYPGAMSDTESYLYRYSWDKEDLQTYPWANHYLHQPEILKYLEHVVAKHDLRKYMQFNTEMLSAEYDEDANLWRVSTSTGETIITRFLFPALGPLFRQKLPDFPGMASFKGILAHSQAWDPSTRLEGKNVAVIGSGSTGVQIITAIASIVKSLVSFQRSPQYSVPSGNGPVAPEYRQYINEHYDEILTMNQETMTGFGFKESTCSAATASAEEREKVFEELWQRGNGLRFMFGGFGDIAFDRTANEAACAFIKKKIASIVTDPEKARKLMPRELYARRPLCDGGYYEQFNRPNVDVVDARSTPITAITESGIRTSDGVERAFDVIICATGFDAIDGAYGRVPIRGRGGKTIQEHWVDGPKSFMGVGMAGFPNLLMVLGPLMPFANFPSALEAGVGVCVGVLGRGLGVAAGEDDVNGEREESEGEVKGKEGHGDDVDGNGGIGEKANGKEVNGEVKGGCAQNGEANGGKPNGAKTNGGETNEKEVNGKSAPNGKTNGSNPHTNITIEVTPEAEASWLARCEQFAEGSLFKEAPSWIFGRNIPGKPVKVNSYFGGLKSYIDTAKDVEEGGWRGWDIRGV